MSITKTREFFSLPNVHYASYYILFLYEETIDLTPFISFIIVLFLIKSVTLLRYHLT